MNSDYIFGSIEQTFSGVLGQLIMSLPLLLGALVVMIIGVLIGDALKAVIIAVFGKLPVNRMLSAAGIDDVTKKVGYKLDIGNLVGEIVKWFVVIIATIVALDILHLNQVSVFLQTVVLGYLPNLVVAVLILFASLIIAKFAKEAVEAAIQASGSGEMGLPAFLPKATYMAIIFFAILAALNQLKIAPELIQILFTGIVFALSLSLGLAFGLGGKDAATKYIDQMSKKQ